MTEFLTLMAKLSAMQVIGVMFVSLIAAITLIVIFWILFTQ